MKKGDRVYLVKERFGRSSPKNPVKGSLYECIGTIDTMEDCDNGDLNIRVDWDNGITNNYSDHDLEKANIMKYKSIW